MNIQTIQKQMQINAQNKNYSNNHINNNYNSNNNNNTSYERVLTPKSNFNFDSNFNNNNNKIFNTNKQKFNRKSQSRTSLNSSMDKNNKKNYNDFSKNNEKEKDSIYLNSNSNSNLNLNLNSNSNLNSNYKGKPQNYKTLKNIVKLSKEKSKEKNGHLRSKNSSFEKSLQNSNSNNNFNQTSVNEYLIRRHLESREKLEQIKNNKFRDEVKELRDRPAISANSKKIAQNIGNKNVNVFDRLTNSNNKKEMEIKKLEEYYNHNSNKPKVKKKI